MKKCKITKSQFAFLLFFFPAFSPQSNGFYQSKSLFSNIKFVWVLVKQRNQCHCMHFVDFIIGPRSQLSPAGNLLLSPFPFPLSLSWWCQNGRKERERGKGKGEKKRLSTKERCKWCSMMMSANCRLVSLGREGETNGGYRKKKKTKKIILENY